MGVLRSFVLQDEHIFFDLTVDDLNNPRFNEAYSIATTATFGLATVTYLAATFVVLKRSTPAMGDYKFLLVAQLSWSYLFELVIFLWKPVVLWPLKVTKAENELTNQANPTYLACLLSGAYRLRVRHGADHVPHRPSRHLRDGRQPSSVFVLSNLKDLCGLVPRLFLREQVEDLRDVLGTIHRRFWIPSKYVFWSTLIPHFSQFSLVGFSSCCYREAGSRPVTGRLQ